MNIRTLTAIAALWLALLPGVTARADAPKHEMRGAWLASVYGLDWPSQTGSTPAVAEAQRAELSRIFDILEAGGFNAVMFQVRSMSDAMYRSSYEPWSAYLTGTRGTAPSGDWDPLAFAVEEAHRRGMELHAWVNPFRVSNGGAPAPVKAAVGSRTFDPAAKGWLITQYPAEEPAPKGKKGSRAPKAAAAPEPKVTILDPGNPLARQHIVNVCREIITNYDVDGLIFDDYFYPERLTEGEGYDFDQWERECRRTGMSQADWRRRNVNDFIAEVALMVRSERPEVRFGVSPAGVAGGNGAATSRYGLNPPSVGSDWMYSCIYCDPLAWLAEGTVDYVSPQIYWATEHPTNPFEPLAMWWSDIAGAFGRHCYASQKVLALDASQRAWQEQEKEVEIGRRYSDPTTSGAIFYSTAGISGKKAQGVAEHLAATVYQYPALMPPIKWRQAPNPGPVTGLERHANGLIWRGKEGMRYVVYALPADLSPLDAIAESGSNFMAEYIVGITYQPEFTIPKEYRKGYTFAVACYDRYGNEWQATML